MVGNRRGARIGGAREARIRELRRAIAAGSYFPATDAVAESLVGWIATPEQFDRRAQSAWRAAANPPRAQEPLLHAPMSKEQDF